MSDALRIITAGWVEFREPGHTIPDVEPATYSNDVFGTVAVMVLQPCMADPDKLRAIAHISGNLTEVFPYMNSARKDAFYNVEGPDVHFYGPIPHDLALPKPDRYGEGRRYY